MHTFCLHLQDDLTDLGNFWYKSVQFNIILVPEPISLFFGTLRRRFIPIHPLIQYSTKSSYTYTRWCYLSKVSNPDFDFNECLTAVQLNMFSRTITRLYKLLNKRHIKNITKFSNTKNRTNWCGH